jgi:hypothetical protein
MGLVDPRVFETVRGKMEKDGGFKNFETEFMVA